MLGKDVISDFKCFMFKCPTVKLYNLQGHWMHKMTWSKKQKQIIIWILGFHNTHDKKNVSGFQHKYNKDLKNVYDGFGMIKVLLSNMFLKLCKVEL